MTSQTPEPTHTPSGAVAHSGSLPARLLSRFRQYVVLRVRYVFRLPMDDLKDEQFRQVCETFGTNSQRTMEALDVLVKMNKSLSERLAYYEENIPRMRELRTRLEKEKLGIVKPNGKIVSLSP